MYSEIKNNKTMTYEEFEQKYYELNISQRIALYNDWCAETGNENIEYFDEDFFDLYFADKMEVCRATAYGEVNFTDEFIRLNVYGNLESFSESEALAIIESNLKDIFEYKSVWEETIIG